MPNAGALLQNEDGTLRVPADECGALTLSKVSKRILLEKTLPTLKRLTEVIKSVQGAQEEDSDSRTVPKELAAELSDLGQGLTGMLEPTAAPKNFDAAVQEAREAAAKILTGGKDAKEFLAELVSKAAEAAGQDGITARTIMEFLPCAVAYYRKEYPEIQRNYYNKIFLAV